MMIKITFLWNKLQTLIKWIKIKKYCVKSLSKNLLQNIKKLLHIDNIHMVNNRKVQNLAWTSHIIFLPYLYLTGWNIFSMHSSDYDYVAILV